MNKETIIGYNNLGIELVQGYGLTETSPVIATETDKEKRPGAVGVVFDSIEVKIENPDENGIGEIVVTAAGVIFIAGVAVEAGSWIIDAVKQWFADKASQETQEAYNDAKEKGEPTDDHSVQNGGSSLPKKGNPNSSKDHVVDGSLKQRRYYDKNGDADMDIDYHHSGVKHKFPHRHYWNNNVRGPEMPF